MAGRAAQTARCRAPAAIVALGLLVAGCGSSSPTRAMDTISPSSAPPSSAPPAASDDGADEADAVEVAGDETVATTDPADGPDVSPLTRCEDVPELEAGVEGSLPPFTNPDEEVMGVLFTYGQERPETFAGLWIDRDNGGTLVMAFTDDPEPHRLALLARGPSPDDVATIEPRPPIADPRPLGERDDVVIDVVRADFTEAELLAASDEFWADRPTYILGGGIDTLRNRISLEFVDPTPEQIVDLAGRVRLDLTCVDVRITLTLPEDPLDLITLDEPTLSCRGGGLPFSASVLDEQRPVAEDEHPATDALLRVLANPPSGPDVPAFPTEGWFALSMTDAVATFAVGTERPLLILTFERSDETWRLSGWGRCAVAVATPPGFGRVDVTLDPDRPPPDPDDTVVHLLLTEQGCASGQAMGDRLRQPEVVETDTEVLIAFVVESPTGFATCPANPTKATTIELLAPLGQRQLRNGLDYPASLIDFPDQ